MEEREPVWRKTFSSSFIGHSSVLKMKASCLLAVVSVCKVEAEGSQLSLVSQSRKEKQEGWSLALLCVLIFFPSCLLDETEVASCEVWGFLDGKSGSWRSFVTPLSVEEVCVRFVCAN